MKAFEKMTWTEFIVFCLTAVGSGIAIGIGGTASLIANNMLGTLGRLVGAVLFSFGIFVIVTFNMKLFTGMVADIPKMGLKNEWRLLVCFLCNMVGVLLVAFLVSRTAVADIVETQGASVIDGKLHSKDWAWTALCSSILCGFLITVSVWSVKYAPRKGLSSNTGVLFPIIVFAFCGFDHSVANTLYFYFLGELSWRVVGYILVTIAGNIIGGVALPLVSLFKEHNQMKK